MESLEGLDLGSNKLSGESARRYRLNAGILSGC